MTRSLSLSRPSAVAYCVRVALPSHFSSRLFSIRSVLPALRTHAALPPTRLFHLFHFSSLNQDSSAIMQTVAVGRLLLTIAVQLLTSRPIGARAARIHELVAARELQHGPFASSLSSGECRGFLFRACTSIACHSVCQKWHVCTMEHQRRCLSPVASYEHVV